MTKYLIEIKYRIVCISTVFITASFTMFSYKFYILHFFICVDLNASTMPFNYFILTSVTELFSVLLKSCLFIVKYITFYFGCYHIISFLALGLYDREYTYLKSFFVKSVFLWALATWLFIKGVLPLTYGFFLKFQLTSTETISLFFEPKVEEYFSFILNLYSQCYTCFQSLLVFTWLFDYTKTNITTIKFLKKYLYIFLLVIATIATPPDVLSQVFLFLFFIGTMETYLFMKIFTQHLIINNS